ncbi:hypothetical protein QTP88_012422 [Uroleucon formosanum]
MADSGLRRAGKRIDTRRGSRHTGSLMLECQSLSGYVVRGFIAKSRVVIRLKVSDVGVSDYMIQHTIALVTAANHNATLSRFNRPNIKFFCTKYYKKTYHLDTNQRSPRGSPLKI